MHLYFSGATIYSDHVSLHGSAWIHHLCRRIRRRNLTRRTVFCSVFSSLTSPSSAQNVDIWDQYVHFTRATQQLREKILEAERRALEIVCCGGQAVDISSSSGIASGSLIQSVNSEQCASVDFTESIVEPRNPWMLQEDIDKFNCVKKELSLQDLIDSELSSTEELSDDVTQRSEDELLIRCREPQLVVFTSAIQEVPVQPFFDSNQTIEGYLVYVVSPLEFYVLCAEDFDRRYHMECLLVACEEFLMEQPLPAPLPGEDYPPDTPCLAFVNDRLNRALIKVSGFDDVQVYLLDYGICHLVPPKDLYQMPLALAQFSYGLAYFCTLKDADSRMLDTFAWKAFLDKVAENFNVHIRGCGGIRRSHGHLVELIDPATRLPLLFKNQYRMAPQVSFPYIPEEAKKF